MHYLLSYELSADYLERRGQFRTEHLALAWQAQSRGDIVIAGALTNPVDQALLVFQGESPAAAEAFAKADPYVLNGLVKRWTVRQWMTVVGDQASAPTR